MKKSLNGTEWLCVDESMEEKGLKCTVIDGEIDPEWNGDNDIKIQYEDNSIAYMKIRRFMNRFRQHDIK